MCPKRVPNATAPSAAARPQAETEPPIRRARSAGRPDWGEDDQIVRRAVAEPVGCERVRRRHRARLPLAGRRHPQRDAVRIKEAQPYCLK